MSPPTVPPPGFSELSTEEKIAYVQALWDLIAANPADVPVDDGQLAILKERLPAARDPETPARPWSEVRTELQARLGAVHGGARSAGGEPSAPDK